ncbi:MAG: DUF1211 domain-containing protein [Chitinophagaceae bacterium]|jgi:uncharacterized membrane protein|nr:DUF1211 domain-containing protein [Chitinophagaceae bacterium]
MGEARHDKSKMHYQLDRISFFSDGVFAIAITLLVIEFKVPVIQHATDGLLWSSLAHMGWKLLGFIISFFIVGYYWSVHHRIFGYVNDYTSRLIWLNLLFLFSVVLLPFSSGLLGEYSSELDLHIPYGIYVLNIVLTAIMNVVLWLYISNPQKKLLTHEISPERIRLGLYFTFVVPSMFLLSFLMTLKFPIVGRLIPAFIPLILKYGLNGLAKRALEKENK